MRQRKPAFCRVFYGHHLYVGVGRGLDRRFPKIPKIQLFRVRSTSTKCDEDTYLRCCSIPAPPSLSFLSVSSPLSPVSPTFSPRRFGSCAKRPKNYSAARELLSRPPPPTKDFASRLAADGTPAARARTPSSHARDGSDSHVA